MEYRKPKIEFYRQRTFTEKMNVTFDFIRENWKPLLKYSFYLIMPVCLVQTFAINSFFSTYMDLIARTASFTGGFYEPLYRIIGSYGVLFICITIGMSILSGLIYEMMQTYAVRENGLMGITLNDFKDNLIKKIWRCLILSLISIFVTIFVIVVMAVLAFISTITLILTVPLFLAFIILCVPIMLILPIYLFEENIDIIDTVKKAWKLGVATIWGMLGLMIVLYILSSVINTVTTMPWYITQFIRMVFSVSSEFSSTQPVIFNFIVYILGLIQSLGMYISMIIILVGLAFQYFHAREKVEGISIESNISNFDEL